MAGWADIAQYVFAITGVLAVGFAYVQIRSARAAARRARVYDYADAFNRMELLRASARHNERWPRWTVVSLTALTEVEQAEWMRLPNLIEEVAYLYNRKALDRDVAAELLGVYVEKLWKSSERLIHELRLTYERPRLFVDWERMQADTWKRRGVSAPLGVDPPALRPEPPSQVNILQWIFSAEYRRFIRQYYPTRRQRPPWGW